MAEDITLQDIVQLFISSGFHRAKLKDLSAFDKIISGFAWCITNCHADIQADIIFQEHAHIGQKIALSEKIVEALIQMTCPFTLEPHQIQGLDIKAIYPSLQWLVERAKESQLLYGDAARNHVLWLYNQRWGRHHVDETAAEQNSKFPTKNENHYIQSLAQQYGKYTNQNDLLNAFRNYQQPPTQSIAECDETSPVINRKQDLSSHLEELQTKIQRHPMGLRARKAVQQYTDLKKKESKLRKECIQKRQVFLDQLQQLKAAPDATKTEVRSFHQIVEAYKANKVKIKDLKEKLERLNKQASVPRESSDSGMWKKHVQKRFLHCYEELDKLTTQLRLAYFRYNTQEAISTIKSKEAELLNFVLNNISRTEHSKENQHTLIANLRTALTSFTEKKDQIVKKYQEELQTNVALQDKVDQLATFQKKYNELTSVLQKELHKNLDPR